MRTRSPVWNALRKARRLNLGEAGLPMPDLLRAGLTRRRVLAALAASAALPAVACTSAPAGKGGPVAVIGGGLSGLVALRNLRKAGVDATLHEARSRLGGRIHTIAAGELRADMGGQFINANHDDVLALAKEFGLSLIDRATLDGREIMLDAGRIIDEAELAQALQPISKVIAGDAEALDQDYQAVAPKIDALSVAQYLDKHAAALGKPYVRRLLEASIRTEFGQEPGAASALELIFNLPVSDGRAYEVLSQSDERFVLQGGSAKLTDALAKELAEHVQTGRELKAVAAAGDGVVLTFADGEAIEAERAIVTLPAPLLRTVDFAGLLPEVWQQYAAQAACGRNEKLNATYKTRVWETGMGRAGAFWPLNGAFCEAWDATTVENEAGLLTWFMGGDECKRLDGAQLASLRREFEGDAAAAIPGLSEAASGWQRRTNWQGDRYARGAYSCFAPGQLTRFAPLFWIEEDGKASQSAVAGPLVFAGEHLSDEWFGFMNGAAQTGRLAAKAVLDAIEGG